MNDNERKVLTRQEADAMLKEGDRVHTFSGSGGLIIGCEVAREQILKLADGGRVELAGPSAAAMRHGIAYNDGGKWYFAETKEANT